MSRVLITGGAGFIGSALVQKLYQSGHSILVLDNLSEQIHGHNPQESSATFKSIQGKCEFHQGDVRDAAVLRKTLQGVEVVVHLAAETGTGQSMYSMATYCDVNIGGTAVLLEEISKLPQKLKKIVVASSRAIYGEGKYLCSEHGVIFPVLRREQDMAQQVFEPLCPHCGVSLQVVPTTEETPPHPLSVYGVTKLSQEQLVLMGAAALEIPAVALRFQNVYGPGQSLSNPYTGILSIFSTRARSNKPINIFEDGKESRDFVFIDDVVNAIQFAIGVGLLHQVAINVGTGVATSVTGVVEHIVKYFSSRSEVKVSGNFRVGDIRHNIADLTRAKELLNFEATVNFEQGIERFLEWASLQAPPVDAYEQSLQELSSRGLLK